MRRNASEKKTKEARRINDGLQTKEAPQGEPCEALLLLYHSRPGGLSISSSG